MSLAAARARLAEVGAADPKARAEALLELAELEPLFVHRVAVVRPLLLECGALLDKLGDKSLEGRVLLRLADIKLVETDLEGVEQLADRARQRLEGDAPRTLYARTLVARAAIRRNQLAAARDMLVALSEQADDTESESLAARRAATTAMFAWAELALEEQDYDAASTRLAALATTLAEALDDDLLELTFACQQAAGLVALAQAKFGTACTALRNAVVIAKSVGALEDELDVRVALAGALVQRGDPVAWDEAEKHLQITRDAALEHNLDSQHTAALVGQAGLMAQKGQTQAALDRCIEIAEVAASKKDLTRYVAAVSLMSGIYERKGDLASAYRTFAEAHAALKEQLGTGATDLFRPPLAAFRARIGQDKFAEIAEAVNKAAHARETFRRRV